MSSHIDNLARPIYPEASHHKPPVSPKYCLRQCPSGVWYLIPFIYEYGFEMLSKTWVKERTKLMETGWGVFPPPAYAKAIDISRLVFEKPEEV